MPLRRQPYFIDSLNEWRYFTIELRGKAVADAHKAILQEKVAAVGDSVITMAVLLVGEDHGALYVRYIYGKDSQELLAMAFVLKAIT